MYSHFDWCEAGYQFGRLRENWATTPARLFISHQEKIFVDNLFKFLHAKIKNRIFDNDDLESFYQQLANISEEINKLLEKIR